MITNAKKVFAGYSVILQGCQGKIQLKLALAVMAILTGLYCLEKGNAEDEGQFKLGSMGLCPDEP
ncbi:MAG: hypothetical protein ACYSSL_10485 [Planctomycetota bacterium]